MTALAVPALLVLCGAWAIYKKQDLFAALTAGAKQGLGVALDILPALAVLLTGVTMLRASGALDALTALCAPAFSLLGIPPETAAIVFLRPFTGSGALAAGSEVMARFGPDSYVGRCAAVMLGSTETTFYVLAVYLGATGRRSASLRRVLPAALLADLTGFVAAAASVRLLYY